MTMMRTMNVNEGFLWLCNDMMLIVRDVCRYLVTFTDNFLPVSVNFYVGTSKYIKASFDMRDALLLNGTIRLGTTHSPG